ncbi:asparagine synthase (glutamine-hydrolyzing) [Streptomyces pactum]|uniref:asparagine synthase (glutamine-hydrolyzing) n=1 Tax=Streptomyces pactum TaxID=68249 RepID=UPI0027DB9A84|nr:asparagine synthase (glutamine-hydrolyzing) [Streptomyces pactum]
MCGIAGWVDYARDLTDRQDVLLGMTATMACRGPDDEGRWAGRHALLGHRRLAVIDPAAGRQPMCSAATGPGGGPEAALTFSGEVYNHRELRAELTGRGHAFRTASDTEVVLRAYLEWGAGFVERLNGMYGFALWDARTEELLLVRDRLGVKPLFYRPTRHGLLFGSEPKAILAHPWAEAVVDTDGLRELFALAKTPGHAVYRGLREVVPGRLVRLSRAGLRHHTYWRLPTTEHTDDLPTTVDTVRELLDDTVTRQLVADVPRCALLSGGLDSSAVTALAARRLAAEGAGPLATFAVDFAARAATDAGHVAGGAGAEDAAEGGGTEVAAGSGGGGTEVAAGGAGVPGAPGAGAPDGGSPDRPYAHAVAAHTGTRHTDIVLPVAGLADPLHRTTALVARDLPVGRGERDTSLYLLFKAVRRHSTVALSGEAADELFGGYGWFHDPAAVASDTFPWLGTGGPGFAGTLDRLLEPGLRKRLDLDTYRRDRHREAVAEVEQPPGATDPVERRMREVGHLALTRFLPRLLERKDRMSMAVGLEARVPFCDHRLVAYVHNTPWAMKTHDGREKSLLRAAVRDLLPAAVADRPKSPYPSTPHRTYTAAVREQFARLLADPGEPVHALLDAGWARRTGRAAAAGPGPGRPADPDLADYLDRYGMETALLLNTWLRRYAVRLDL